MITTVEKEKNKSIVKKRSTKKISDDLIYETLDGEKIYYKNYLDVVNGIKTKEEIMGSSTLQSVLVEYMQIVLFAGLDRKFYRILTGEIGIHLESNSNFSNDIAVYEKSVLTPNKINNKYADVPPKIVIEIDIKANTDKAEDYIYVQRKTQKLLDFGVEKVIWIFTDTKKVSIATQNDAWLTVNWDKDMELLNGLIFNISQYLQDEGIEQ
jgi:Uma2 family endonuclease